MIKQQLSIEDRQEILAYLCNLPEGSTQVLYEKLFTYFCQTGQISYEIASGRSDDPFEWVMNVERLQTLVSDADLRIMKLSDDIKYMRPYVDAVIDFNCMSLWDRLKTAFRGTINVRQP